MLKHIKASWKHTVSGLLAAVMIIGILPSAAFAAETTSPYAPTGDFELNVAGTTAWNSADEPLTVYKTESGSARVTSIPTATPFALLEDNGSDRLKVGYVAGGGWAGSTLDGTGWVDKENVLVNLPDVIPSIAYERDSSKWFNSRLTRHEYVVPATYEMAEQLAQLQKEVMANGNTLAVRMDGLAVTVTQAKGDPAQLHSYSLDGVTYWKYDKWTTADTETGIFGYELPYSIDRAYSADPSITLNKFAPQSIKRAPAAASVTPTGDVGAYNPGSPGGGKPSTSDVAWASDAERTFLRFTLIEFPEGVVKDIGNNDYSTWHVVGTPLNVVWNKDSSGNVWSVDKCRSDITWYNSCAMQYNGQGVNAPQLMAGTVYSYDATSNPRWVTTADEFQKATGITDQQKEQMFHCNSKSWSTGWIDGDYTSMWGTDPQPVTPNNLYKVYKANDAFLYLLNCLSSTDSGNGWSADEAMTRWSEYVHDADGNLRTKYRIIVETGLVVKDPDGHRRAYTLREAMAYTLYNNESESRYNLIWDQATPLNNAARWMRQGKDNQFVEYPLKEDGTPTGEELHSTNGFKECDSYVDTIEYARPIRDTIFKDRVSFGLHIFSPFNFEKGDPAKPSLDVTKKTGDGIPAGEEWGFTVNYTAGAPTSFVATKNGTDCTSQVTSTSNGLKFKLKADETIHIDFEADSSFRCTVTEDDSSKLTSITGTGGTADMAAKKFTTTGGAAKVTFTNGDDPPPPPTPDPDPGKAILFKRDANTNTGVGPATFKFSSVTNGVYEFDTNASGELETIQWWDPTEAAGKYIKPGEYAVSEQVPPPNYMPTTEVQQIKLELDEDGNPIPAGPLVFKNLAKVGLKIVKYDRQSHRPMSNVSFEIFRDGVSIGRYETNGSGEIVLTNIEPGTYRAVEVDTGDEGHILDTSYQEVELIAGGGTKELIFFNDVKPGMRLLKVDSSDPSKTIPNAKFRIRAVDGSFGPQEFVTNGSGEIDLSNLPEGSYEVIEVECNGYVVDDAQRIIHLRANDKAEFVFTNTKKPGFKLVKRSADGTLLDGVTFKITPIEDASHSIDRTTQNGGEILVEDLEPGVYSVVETATLPNHILDTTEYHVELSPGKVAELRLSNDKKPGFRLIKTSDDGTPLKGVTFRISKIEDGSRYIDRTTNEKGEIFVEDLDPGMYSVVETATLPDHILDKTEHHVELFPNKTSELRLKNDKRPNLIIWKRDADTGEIVPNTVFLVKAADGHSVNEVKTGPDGKGVLENLLPGVYEISEKSVPEPYLQDAANQLVTLYPNKDREVLFENHKRPSIEIIKENSITHERQANVPFQVWYASNNTSTGEYNDLGVFYTNEEGRIILTEPEIYLRDGWFRVKELEPPHGFALADPDTQEAFIPSGTSHTFIFQNRPLSAICVWKYDSVSPNMAIEGAVFQIRYLSGNTSGTGGTVIGTYRTGQNGSFTATGLPAGTYIIEELSSDGDHVIDTPPQTVYLSGNDQEVIQVHFGNSPKGSLMVKKVDSVTKQPLSDVEFLVTDSKGNVVGDANGKFVTDSTGSFTISGIDPSTTLIVKEVRAKDGYIMDDVPQTATVNAGQTVTLEFRNQPLGALLVRKVCSVNPSVTLPNAEFKVAYSDGTLIGDSNGIYRSDENGEVRIDGLIPGKSVVVTETRAPAGFLIDAQPQTAVVQAGRTVTITMKNQPRGQLIIQKRDSQTNEVLSGAQFRVTTAAGCEVGLDGVIGDATLTQNGIFTTDSQGEIRITNLAPGAYVLSEIKAPDGGYVIDNPSTNVVIGPNGDTQTVIVTNTRKGNLVVEKYDSVTKQPLKNAQCKITTASGELVPDNEGMTSSNGIYTTDQNGQIVLSKVLPQTYIISEYRAPDNYRADPTPQTVVVNAGDTQTVRFYDDPLCTLTILKRDAVTKKPLKGAEFLVKDSTGQLIGPDNGIYTTGIDGTVTVSGLTPDSTIIVSEYRAPTGYLKDESPKNIVVRTGVANSLIFDDEPATTLIIQKFIEGTANEPLAGVCFKVTDGSGAAVGPDDGVYYTDHAGEIVLSGLEPGTTVKAREIRSVEGFVLDGTPQDILIRSGEVQRLTFWNARAGTLVIQKKDSVSGAFISNAQFQLTYANGGYVDNDNGHLSSNGLYTTDDKGEIRISGVVGTIVAKEVKPAPGYTIDQSTQIQTVTVNPMDTQTLVFLNEPLCSLTLSKKDSITGKPVPNTEFTVKDGNGTVLGRYTTGKDGTVVVTGLVPGSTIVVSESRVPEGYVLDTTPQTIIVKNGTGNSWVSGGTGSSSGGNGSITGGSTGGDNNLTFENDPKTTLTIEKVLETETGNQPLKGVTFLVTDSSGAVVGPNNGEYTTDENGRIVIPNLEPGVTITARETKVPSGVVLDSTPKSIKIKAGEGQTLRFVNQKAGNLILNKVDGIDKHPLSGVRFKITYADGSNVDQNGGTTSTNGIYTTDTNGQIKISGIVGTVVITEIETVPGYYIKEEYRTQTVEINPNDTQTVTVYNVPTQALVIQKFEAGSKDKPLAGVEFLVTDSDGTVIGPNNGIYKTDQFGRITIKDLTPGTVITARETKCLDGYVLDSSPQSIEIRSGEVQTMTFYNAVIGGLELIKVSEADKTQRIKGVTFEIRKMDGALVDTVTTGDNGRVHVSLDAGDYYCVEIEAAAGFKKDGTPHYFTVRDNETTTVTVTNAPFSGVIIHKVDSVTKEGIYDVKFLLYNQDKNPIGEYSTDDQGYIYIDDLTVQGKGKLFIRELEAAPGYELDKQYKTIYVQPGKTVEIEWENTPITGQFQIYKYAAEYNEITGTPAGTPLQGAVYEISEARSGKVVDYITTDARGVAASKPLPLGRYKIVETTAPAYWQVSGTIFDETLEYSGQIIKVSDYDKPSNLGVTITKRGNAEALAGSSMRYDFTVANTSNVPLENFYWHDRIPTDAARATIFTTGTYSARLNYRILYKTNYSATYQVLASNLITSSNYSFSLNAIPTQAGEYVTDIYLDFGKVPVGFQSVANPTLTVTVSGTAANGYQLVNRADVGGKYQGTWQTGQATWVTVIRKLTPTYVPTLPKTGY